LQTTTKLGSERAGDAAADDAAASLSAALRGIYHEASALVHDHLRLAALEARRAVRDLVAMIALAIVGALLVLTGWLALVAGLVAWAVDHGTSWPAAFFVAAVISAATAVGAGLCIRYLGSRVMFALTLRWLRPAPRAQAVPTTATRNQA
jgi:uncharacterized membrane protein YqjE